MSQVSRREKEVRQMVIAIFLLVLLCFPSPSFSGVIYQWVDKNGTFNFTDDHEKVPSAYREDVQQRVIEDISETESLVLPSAPTAESEKEEIKRDIYGLGKEWWRAKAHPWEEQLIKGTEDLEIVKNQYMEESEKLILRKFGSHQQFKSTILDLERIKEHASKHKARIKEAKELLKKLSKDAEESNADPSWLTSAPVARLSTALYQAEFSTDIYGRDEAWWRSQVFDQREQLKKAVEDYEKAYEDYNEHVEKLSPSRFGGLSLTQYQMFSYKLDILSKEMVRHQVRIAEANESLKKLLKEAEESKANPEWLRE